MSIEELQIKVVGMDEGDEDDADDADDEEGE